MKKYKFKIGDLFTLPTRDELIKFGWVDDHGHLTHPGRGAYVSVLIVSNMLPTLGTVVTIKSKDMDCDGCYIIEDDPWDFTWPIDLLDKQTHIYLYGTMNNCSISNTDCEEGITPILGYIICKYCGKNIREILK